MCHYLEAVASICEFNGVIGPIRPLTSHDLDLFGQIQSILRKAPLEVIGICSVRVCKSPGKKEQRFKLVNNYKFAIYICATYYYINYIYTYVYIYRLKAGGSPELPGTLSLEPILQTSLWYRDGGWGVGGCNNVMWSALH